MEKELLIVDDQPGIRLLLEDVLSREGYTVSTASNGKEAIDLLKQKPFVLMILDYKLPVIDGLGVLQEINTLNVRTPVVVMSGLVEKIDNELEEFSQVKKIMAKPFNIQDIPIIVKQAIESTEKI